MVATLKAEPRKGIWLYGGGGLLATLLAAGLVDKVELVVIPVLLEAGLPLMCQSLVTALLLTDHRSGIDAPAYSVQTVGPAAICYVSD